MASKNYNINSNLYVNEGKIVGGYNNTASGSTKSSIVGGQNNSTYGYHNFIGGGSGNTSNTNYGVVVGGANNLIPSAGAYKSSIVGGGNNQILNANKSFIGGGEGNELRQNANLTFIGGGSGNTIGITGTSAINGQVSVIVGGANNYISSGGKGFETTYGFIGGGSNNYLLEGTFSFIGSGAYNRITGSSSTIVGGGGNEINGDSAFIGGGGTNIINSAPDSLIGGGRNNYIGNGADHSIIIGGKYNYIKPIGSSGPFIQTHNLIGGGYGNRISLYSNSTSSDGKGNNIILNSKKATMYGYSYNNHNTILNTGWLFSTPISNYSSGIFGGSHNSILGGAASYNGRDGNPSTGLTHAIIGNSYVSTLVSGYGNMINDASYSTIVNGYHNYIGDTNHTSCLIGTGYANKISKSSDYSTIVNGDRNGLYYTQNSFIGAGRDNIISGTSSSYATQSRQSSILSGRGNLLRSSFSSIIGGRDNTINLSSPYSSILGGQNNTISHTNSHIIGSNITSVSANTTHVEKLNIKTLNTGTTAVSSLGLDINGMVVSVTDATTASNGLTKTGDNITLGGTLTGDTNIDLSGSIITFEGESLRLLSDATELVEFAMAAGLAGGGIGFRGFSDISFPNYGKQGDMFIRSGADSNGLSIISYPGTGTDDSIRFFAGDPLGASGIPNIHIQGSGSTIGYVGIGTDTPLAKHHVEIAAIPGDEIIQLWSISDSLNGLRVINGTTASNTFLPTLIASSVDNDNIGMFYTTQITIDTGVNPVTVFDSRLPAAIVAVRPLFSWDSFGTSYMTMSANGDLGIGTTTPNTKLDINGGYATRGKAGTIPITATTDDWDFGDSSYIRAEPLVSNQLITGIANGVDGKRVVIMNNSATFDLTFTYNDVSSTINNRLLNNTASTNLIVGPNKCVEYIYDVNDNRWRQIGGTAF